MTTSTRDISSGSGRQREGSPWTGLPTIALKELTDQLGSARIRILAALIILTAIGATYIAIQELKQTVAEDPFIFLRLLTAARDPLPSFLSFLTLFVPLTAITLGFDGINGERSRRTLPRILAQPIYRDALILAKFLAGLATLAVMLLALWLLVTGLGLIELGVAPSGEEVLRGLAFLAVTLAYAGVWLGLALLCSVLFRQPATSALAAVSVWLVFAFLWPVLIDVGTQALQLKSLGFQTSGLDVAQLQLALSRISPNTIFGEVALALLHPATRSLGPILFSQLEGAVLGTPLPFSQSLMLVWPQITGLVAAMIAILTVTYISFQRQEIRS
ncbi:MAG TPA: ABC transporter permease [Stellaceae bacterium]|nr:ABC transporter permease [Stellaceae bacterium]